MSVAPVTGSGAKRRIGDILLELGFATEETLANAAAEQERTGQPLGQILVDQGAITRLELASALAEQWSEHASITPIPIQRPSPSRTTPQPADDEYAARLQAAVADLSEGVRTTAPADGFESRVTEIAERVESTVARTQRIEVTMATLAESLEGVTGGVEEAFGVLQSGMSGLALDLARLDTAVAELLAAPAATEPNPLEEQLEELRGTVESLARRQPVDEDARARVEEISARVETAAEGAAVDDLRGTLAAIERRVEELAAGAAVADEVEAQRAVLGELRSAVAELESRPSGSPDVDARLARIEADLAERLAAVPEAAAVESLAARLESATSGHEGLLAALAELRTRVDDAVAKAGPDEAITGKLTALEAGLATACSDLEAMRRAVAERPATDVDALLADVRAALGTLRDDVAALSRERPPDLSAQVSAVEAQLERLSGDRHEQAAVAARLEELEHRLHEGYVTSDDLAHAFERVREQLRPDPPLPDPRVDEIAQDVAALREDLARADGVPAAELATLADRVEHLGAREDPRVAQLTSELEALREDVARIRVEPAGGPDLSGELAGLAARLDELARAQSDAGALGVQLEALERRLTAVVTPDDLAQALGRVREELRTPPPAAGPDPMHELAALAARLDELARAQSDEGALRLQLEALEQRLAAVVTPDDLAQALGRVREELAAAPPPAPDAQVERLALEMEALRREIAGASAGPDAMVTDELGRLAERFAALEARVAEAAATPVPPPDTSELDGAVASLAERLAALEGLGARVEEIGTAVTRAAEAPQQPADDLRAELDGRLAELAHTLEERFAAGARDVRGDGHGSDEGIEDELERTRMAIERLSLHLGEHDRALVELRGSRAVSQRLDELAGRIDELAAGGAVAPPAQPEGSGRYVRRSLEPDIEMRSLIRRLEDVEEAATVGREKLMNRLERMASSIDWRLQRLEAGDQE